MIRNKLTEIEIPDDRPFANDKLDREECADTFITMTSMYVNTGCVIALNSDWGTGKTTFIKMTMQKMIKDGYHPIYFNAWENDYVEDPLIALLSGIKEVAPTSNKWNGVIANGGKIAIAFAGSIVKSVLKNKLGLDPDTKLDGVDASTEIIKSSLEDFEKHKLAFVDFRKSLIDFIAEHTGEDKPVVFFVDELDRCNPYYAVKVLERIKHLFDIPNIVFVLSICKKQFEYAIQGYYGNSNIDAANYLRRFIDIEFTLPKPDSKKFFNYLWEEYDFAKIFEDRARLQNYESRNEQSTFKNITNILLEHIDLDLRTIDKIFAHTRLVLCTFSNEYKILPDVLFLMCWIKILDPDLYAKIKNHHYSAQKLLESLENYLPSNILQVRNSSSGVVRRMAYTLLNLISMYDTDKDENQIERIFRINENDNPKLKRLIIDEELFFEAYKTMCNGRYSDNIPLDYILKKIDIHEKLIVNR